MNYRHAFHAGNHADVLKHVVLLALCEALKRKPAPWFALDTHAGRGLYALDGAEATRTGEAAAGIGRLEAAAAGAAAVDRYLAALRACRAAHGAQAYPGSPWLLAHAARAGDRIACCELQAAECDALRGLFARDPRVAVHCRDGYAATKALLPPVVGGQRLARGLVLVDPPYELQRDEFALAMAALRTGLARWPQGCFALWYPVKRRRALHGVLREAAALPASSALLVELMVRPDDSPLRMNGSGLLLLQPPYALHAELAAALPVLRDALDAGGGSTRLEWLRPPP